MPKKRGRPTVARQLIVPKMSDHKTANAEVVLPVSGPMIMPPKVCRLCETKDGPFLNIFGGEKNTAKTIEQLMPFSVAENDELPHKICFRCSAKVEELHEFLQKCIKTQENLCQTIGRKFPSTTKAKTHRSLWEEQLHKSNTTNDDICNAVIKKAMEGIKDIALAPKSDVSKSGNKQGADTASPLLKKAQVPDSSPKQSIDTEKKPESEIKIKKNVENKNKSKDVNVNINKADKNEEVTATTDKSDKRTTRTSLRSKNSDVSLVRAEAETDVSPKIQRRSNRGRPNMSAKSDQVPEEKAQPVLSVPDKKTATVEQNITKEDTKEETKAFDIMVHVSMIKVNGVGVLFQCKLCNRNFLKKEVVLAHWCAKNGAAKEDFTKKIVPPVPPKVPTTVKYINTKIDSNKTLHGNLNKSDSDDVIEIKEEIKLVNTEPKPKPKIGPASKVKKYTDDPDHLIATKVNKVKKYVDDSDHLIGMKVTPCEPSPPHLKKNPSVQCVNPPSLNCRYKLVPGPNNTYTLVEIFPNDQKSESSGKDVTVKKRQLSADNPSNYPEPSAKLQKVHPRTVDNPKSESHPEIIDLEETINLTQPEPVGQPESVSHPYPVGLFQTVKPHTKEREPPKSTVMPFFSTALKKQSYTVVQTDNPSKLLISAKPQPQNNEPLKKRQKKIKIPETEPPEQPFSITLEDTSQPKDGFFTFVNLDPLLQPSYVLPTDNSILQEAQISTSLHNKNTTASKLKNEYTCNMCNEKFNREQKLLVHIHSHYSKLDEEDQTEANKANCKKRGKKS